VDFGTFVRVALALAAFLLIWKAGRAMLGGLVRPIPEPPPPGELRKVKITYRCSICGTEVRMTVANDEVPDPPRHCQDEMELVAPVLE
jgi:threonine dehydrogenase-like Zn-dependent dehydrogenase